MSKALVIIKSMGIGDLVILIANIHAISKAINRPVVVMAQKNTHAYEILKHDPHIEEVLDLDRKGILNIVKKIKPKNFQKSYIYSDSLRLNIISKLAGIKENFQYKLFSKKGKNFFKTAKDFTEKTLNTKMKLFRGLIFFGFQFSKFETPPKPNLAVCSASAIFQVDLGLVQM